MAGGFYRRLPLVYPDARRTLIVPDFLAGLAYPEVFHEVRAVTLAERKRVDALWSFSRWISEARFDEAFILPATLRATLPFFLARVPERVGFSSALSAPFLTRAVSWQGVKSGRHKSELYNSLLGPAELIPAKTTSGAPQKLIVMAPGASIELREWPFYEELAKILKSKYPSFRIVLVGTLNESRVMALAERLSSHGVESLIGQTSIKDLVRLCREAAVVIANDSGVAHVAGTLANAATVVLFGPGDPKYVTPAGDWVTVVRNEKLDCSPCESSICKAPHGYQACLKTLTVDEVLAAVQNSLSNTALA